MMVYPSRVVPVSSATLYFIYLLCSHLLLKQGVCYSSTPCSSHEVYLMFSSSEDVGMLACVHTYTCSTRRGFYLSLTNTIGFSLDMCCLFCQPRAPQFFTFAERNYTWTNTLGLCDTCDPGTEPPRTVLSSINNENINKIISYSSTRFHTEKQAGSPLLVTPFYTPVTAPSSLSRGGLSKRTLGTQQADRRTGSKPTITTPLVLYPTLSAPYFCL